MEDNIYSEISEMIYWASHDENENEIIPEVQPIDVKFDMKPIIDLALDTKDEEWFLELVSK